MPFGKPFYKKRKLELSKEEQDNLDARLAVKLLNIYGEPVRDYQNIADFEPCKKQLELLLVHIVRLNPKKLQLFERYKAGVLKLPIYTTAIDDITVTLRATKRTLEQSLFDIENNHEHVDGAALDSYIVDDCYSGAYSNIETAVSLFTASSLDLIVENAKRHLLKAIAQNFSEEQRLTLLPGNEIHDANGLFNHMAVFYGLPLDNEPLANNSYSEDILNSFEHFAKTKITVSAFMRSLKLLITPPYARISSDGLGLVTMSVDPETVDANYLKALVQNKNAYVLFSSNVFYVERRVNDGVTITRLDSNDSLPLEKIFPDANKGYKESSKEDLKQIALLTGHIQENYFKKLEDFFTLLGENGSIYEQMKHLYTIKESEDSGEITWVPKAEEEFQFFYTCMLAFYLEKAGYLENLRLTIENRNLFYNGETLVEITPEGAFECLSDRKITSFLMSLRAGETERELLLYQQLSTAALLEFYKTTGQMVFFKLLMEKEDIATTLEKMTPLELLSFQSTEEKETIFADYTFKNNWQLPEEVLDYLVKYLPVERQMYFFDKAIRCNNPTHITRFLENNYELQQLIWSCEYSPFHQAVFYDAYHVIPLLHRNGYDFNAADVVGNTALILAIFKGHMKSLRALAILGADVNQRNTHSGHTPVSIVVQQSQFEALSILHEFGATLDNNDYSVAAYTPLCHAVLENKLDMLKRLLELGANPNRLAGNRISASLLAAGMDRPEFLSVLADFRADLNIKERRRGGTPAHIAAFNGCTRAFVKLKELNACLDALDHWGVTPAFIAARMGRINIIECVLDLPSTHSVPHFTTEKALLDFHKYALLPSQIKDRMLEVLGRKITRKDQAIIRIYPKDVAFIMGHDDIVELFKRPRVMPQIMHPNNAAESDVCLRERARYKGTLFSRRRKSEGNIDFINESTPPKPRAIP